MSQSETTPYVDKPLVVAVTYPYLPLTIGHRVTRPLPQCILEKLGKSVISLPDKNMNVTSQGYYSEMQSPNLYY